MYSTNLLVFDCFVFNLIFNFWQLLEHFIVPFCHVRLTLFTVNVTVFNGEQ